ncbi:UNVERIFIED_CONTAM: hypothetical protein Slati_3444100 [Sesamum latifolium]|uniref:Uncharacterized protein n=1 Tax=Sesamum latifolium TaxID=2727402 RepID=A0AAW2UHK7_9LAMI
MVGGFAKSSLKVLGFVESEKYHGTIVVKPTKMMVADDRGGGFGWLLDTFGCRSYFSQLQEFTKSTWPTVKEVFASFKYFFPTFKSKAAMEEVIKGRPWLFQAQPIFLQRWTLRVKLECQCHKLMGRNLLEYWMEEGLNVIASGVGQLLYPDAVMRSCMKVDYARVRMLVGTMADLPKHLVMCIQLRLVSRGFTKVCLPPFCKECEVVGHSVALKLGLQFECMARRFNWRGQSSQEPVLIKSNHVDVENQDLASTRKRKGKG